MASTRKTKKAVKAAKTVEEAAPAEKPAGDEIVIESLKNEIASLKKQLEAAKAKKPAADKKQLEALRDENDKYLMKISELTFENARLTAQIENLKKPPTPAPKRPRTLPGQVVDPAVYGSGRTHQGYTDWN